MLHQLVMTAKFKVLQRAIWIIMISVHGLSMAQERYRDSIFGEIRVRTFDYADTLKLDFYDAALDSFSLKPVIILVHGGGFSAGQRNGEEEVKLARKFAQRGYGVASISYRLTMKNRDFGCHCAIPDKLQAYINGVDDLKKAKYFLTTYASDFQIDPKKIILVGSSAGAETVLNSTIMKDHYLFKQVDRDEGKVIGLISMSGATLESHYLSLGNAVPMLFFHGKQDKMVPFGIGSHHTCLPKSEGYLMLDGPVAIADRLNRLQTAYELYFDPMGGHEWADIAFGYFDTMAAFLYHVVLQGEFRQKIHEITAPIHK